MANRRINARIMTRRDTAANWETRNPILEAGEFGYDTTNDIVKVGDGVTPWNMRKPLTADNSANALTWSMISEISQSGRAQEFFKIGDTKDIFVTRDEINMGQDDRVVVGGETITLEVIGFNHDTLSEGGGTAGITFGMKNLFTAQMSMNITMGTGTNWSVSQMRQWWLQPQILFRLLPVDLQNNIKLVNKSTRTNSNTATLNVTQDRLFLFSETEITGGFQNNGMLEGEQYEYWRTIKDGTIPQDRLKMLSNGSGAAVSWNLRSPHIDTPQSGGRPCFRSVGGSGNITWLLDGNRRGVCFGFCI